MGLISGSLNGVVSFWDISRQALRNKTKMDSAVTKMCWGADALLFVSTVDGVIYVFNGRNGKAVWELTGHLFAVLDFQIDKSCTMLVAASDDETCKIFHIKDIVNCV